MALPVAASAADYKPVVCTSAVTYAGAPLHPPVAPPLLGEVPKDKLDPEAVARLEAAFAQAKAATKAPAMTAAVLIPGKGGWSSHRQRRAAADAVLGQRGQEFGRHRRPAAG
ncbi:hypothetical protein [Caulobacter sp. UC70_42]|uniref:hypothetical protein n=1 Tax=Caulobacter sp. UC70_42 TaxID=3374551 RepID=UPI0037571899